MKRFNNSHGHYCLYNTDVSLYYWVVWYHISASPCSFISASTARRQVTLSLLLFRFPSAVQKKAVFKMLTSFTYIHVIKSKQKSPGERIWSVNYDVTIPYIKGKEVYPNIIKYVPVVQLWINNKLTIQKTVVMHIYAKAQKIWLNFK